MDALIDSIDVGGIDGGSDTGVGSGGIGGDYDYVRGNGSRDASMQLQVGPLAISGAVIDRFGGHVSSFASKLTMDTLRPLPIFLGLTPTGPSSFCISADAFSPPSTHADKTAIPKFRTRVSLNLAYFATNYALLAAGTAVVVALMHPFMLLYLGIVWALWSFHLVMVREDVRLVVMERDLRDFLTPRRRSVVLTLFTAWVVVDKCSKPFLLVVAISSFVVLFHAVMRDPKRLDPGGRRSGSPSVGLGSSDSDDEGSGILVECSEP